MSRFMRIPEVIEKTGAKRSTIWYWVKLQKFLKPIKLSEPHKISKTPIKSNLKTVFYDIILSYNLIKTH